MLAAAIAAAGIYYVGAHDAPKARHSQPASLQSDHAKFAARSPAYLFGFANAALGGCRFIPGAALDQLAAAVEAGAQGVVPEEVSAGFADFHGLQQASGTAGACRIAEQLFGPHAQARPGVLLPP